MDFESEDKTRFNISNRGGELIMTKIKTAHGGIIIQSDKDSATLIDQLKALIEEMEERRERYLQNNDSDEYLRGFYSGKWSELIHIIEKLKLILEENENRRGN